ncbi:MAG: hypothetical protein AAFY76_23140, partial [Cyanobacteria bacterium J06649_11]
LSCLSNTSQLLKNCLWEFNRDFLRCHWLLDVACFYTFYINTGKLSGIVEIRNSWILKIFTLTTQQYFN